MSKILNIRKIIKYFSVLGGAVLLLLLILITRIDRTPFEETDHFKEWKQLRSSFDFKESYGNLQMGWAKVNITPGWSAPLAGYGKRKGKHFESVNDSIFVRAISLIDSSEKVYFVSADLLFIPPKVVQKLKPKLEKAGISLKDVHFSATHSHNSIGGWENTLTGELFGGKFDQKIVDMLAEKFFEVIVLSSENVSAGELFYSEAVDNDDIRYRIDAPNGVRDTEIRSLTFRKENGEAAHLITYAAHSTVLSAGIMKLSRDYSGALVDSLKPDFAMFMAGAVASMGPVERGETEFKELENQASGVLNHFKERNEIRVGSSIISELIKIPLPEPTGRLTENLALRTWVFKRFFGSYDAYIKVTKIGNVLILGMPADFSGEIMVELDAYARRKGLDLIITGFNGGYVGYITPDKLYDSGTYETVTMSWYGYQSGGYFTQISKDIIDILSKQ